MNRVKTTTTTTGTGSITVSASAAARCKPLSSVPVGRQVEIVIEDESGTDWEYAACTILSATTFSRDIVIDGTNGPGVKTNFVAGAKSVFVSKAVEFPQIPFSTALPLNREGDTFMAPFTVAGPLTLTLAAAAVRNAWLYVRITADGVNKPVVPGKELIGSAQYDNRAGIVNMLQIWNDGFDTLYLWSQDANATPAAVPDTTAPILTSPTSASTGQTTGSGSVTTNEANGTLYFLASINATETAATVKASGGTQAITTTGSKAVTVSGLTASTLYYIHFVHRDAAGNDSARVTSASFTTAAVGDTTAPTLSAPTATKTGSTTATGSVTTNEANGTLYYMASANAVESAATVKAGASQAVTATGAQAVSFTGLAAATTLYGHFLHRDAAGNDSTVANSGSFVTDAAATSSLRFGSLVRATESGSDPYTYTGSGTSVGFGQTEGDGVLNKAFQSGADGEFVVKVLNTPTGTSNELLIGVDASASTPQQYTTIDYAVVGHLSGYQPFTSGTPGTAIGTVTAANDYVKVSRVGTALTIKVSKDSGATYPTTAGSWTVGTGVFYIHMLVTGTGSWTPISSSGLA